ncbi:MAG TPA: SRPBCC domain-containing protein [Candidatus Limnocylindria bacterium]|jgi:uncharacterized protein YndB with AHSA1/START domain|nr:SRPBCC domain-containing protein [Candidatus Limnocylindria bacterium]
MSNTQAPTAALVIRRTYKASRSRVFAAWTQPELLRQWFAPPPGWTIPEATIDARVGGTYRITFRSPDGTVRIVGGVFREYREPERFSYTWAWDDRDRDAGEMLVSVDLRDHGDETELILTHENFADQTSYARHEGGWQLSLTNLAAIL